MSRTSPSGWARRWTATLGFELTEAGEELARGHFEVTDRCASRWGSCTAAPTPRWRRPSRRATTYVHVQPESIAVGLSNSTSFMRPVSEGTVHAEARRRHRGRTTWVWDVDFTDDEGRLCASSRVTMAIRPTPA